MSVESTLLLSIDAFPRHRVRTQGCCQPISIHEQHTNSDQTINDAIIAALRKCKFCIADFSYHSNGVYFESGFALGQGKQVIYTCSKEEFANAHFDIRPLQHIIYENPEQLRSSLVNKIEAWIK
ncbi:MAG: hypothetical protein ACK4WD_12995 [Flavobacteriales bacterium]|jgi:nucleoside 2-deoxyribosyltransferase